MAQKVQVVLEDDIDGSSASETVAFSLDGVSYEIDLNEQHATELRDAIQPWISAGRRMSPTPRSRSRKSAGSASARSDAAAIRAWAKEHGHDVPARGRIPAKIREAYEAR